MTGVALFNASYNIKIHLCFAFIAFFNGVAFMMLQTHIDGKLRAIGGALITDLRLYRLRQLLCCLSVCGLFAMFGLFNYYIPLSRAGELTMVASQLSYFATWQPRFKTRMFLAVENAIEVWEVDEMPITPRANLRSSSTEYHTPRHNILLPATSQSSSASVDCKGERLLV